MTNKRRCGICGKKFTPSTKHRKYCSYECAKEKKNKIVRKYYHNNQEYQKHDRERKYKKAIKEYLSKTHLYLPEEFTEKQIETINNKIYDILVNHRNIRGRYKRYDSVVFAIALHCSRKHDWGWDYRSLNCAISTEMKHNNLNKKLKPEKFSKKVERRRRSQANTFYKTLCQEIDEFDKVKKEYYGWTKNSKN